MKYKIKQINDSERVVISDEEIKEGDWYIYAGQISQRFRKNPLAEYPKPAYLKIISAEKELNVDVPILPNFRDWEVEKEANKAYKEYCEKHNIDYHLLDASCFYIGYNHNKNTYTKEDLRKAMIAIHKKCYGRMYDEKDEECIIKSLDKIPQYIVLETNERCKCGTTCEFSICKHESKPKLITNSEGKKEVIIKEILW